MRRRTFKVVALLALGCVLVTAGWVAARQIRTPEQQAAAVAPPTWSQLTALVRAGPLVDELAVPGTLVSTVEHRVTRSSGTLTGLRTPVGSEIQERGVLAEVNGRPVICLRGPFPAFRDLQIGMQGSDVAVLKDALKISKTSPRAPAFEPFDHRTYVALSAVYRSAGYPAPPQDTMPAAEMEFIPELPLTVTDATPVGGAQAGTLIVLKSTGLKVSVPLEQSTRSALTPGTRVTAITAGGRHLGTVESATPATPSGDGASQEQTPTAAVATVVLDTQPQATAGDAVEILVERRRSEPGLIVPASAVWTGPDGGTRVTAVGATGETPVPVTVLLSANGLVAVSTSDSTLLVPDQTRVVISTSSRAT